MLLNQEYRQYDLKHLYMVGEHNHCSYFFSLFISPNIFLLLRTTSNIEFKSGCMKGFAMLAFPTFECIRAFTTGESLLVLAQYGKLKEPVRCTL